MLRPYHAVLAWTFLKRLRVEYLAMYSDNDYSGTVVRASQVGSYTPDQETRKYVYLFRGMRWYERYVKSEVVSVCLFVRTSAGAASISRCTNLGAVAAPRSMSKESRSVRSLSCLRPCIA